MKMAYNSKAAGPLFRSCDRTLLTNESQKQTEGIPTRCCHAQHLTRTTSFVRRPTAPERLEEGALQRLWLALRMAACGDSKFCSG